MTAPTLKDLRHDLGDHLADGLGAAHAPLGSQVNPPAVIIQHGVPYIEANGYMIDGILFQAVIVGEPGDPEAVADSIDDMIDQVRAVLRTPSYAGNRFGFRSVDSPTTYGDKDFPAIVVTIGIDRESD